MKEVAPAARDYPDAKAVRRRGIGDRFDRHTFFENVVEIQVEIAEIEARKDLERWQKRFPLV